ncbi:TetR/AcrR family transcriptional regulator [Arcobacteraceae bacterium]|nr:TetR/AcrR family transcriptional regulator [Arcobacteraceae bacterium]
MSTVKERLIDATFEEVHKKGCNAASLADILHRAEVKKGAMYHYYPSKNVMILEMIELKLIEKIDTTWKDISDTTKDEIDTIIALLTDNELWDFECGCPLGNLLQESLEKEFSDSLYSILNHWKMLLIKSLESAKKKNLIQEQTDIEQCATFIIASFEGALLITKKSQDNIEFEKCMKQLSNYLNFLRV